MKSQLYFFVAFVLLSSHSSSADDTPPQKEIDASSVGRSIVIVGKLGFPVGEELTIAGIKIRNGPLENIFWVESVNGNLLKTKVAVSVSGINSWPDKTKATLRGTEVGTLQFLQLHHTNYALNDPRWRGPRQKLFLEFVPTKLVSPQNLNLSQQTKLNFKDGE